MYNKLHTHSQLQYTKKTMRSPHNLRRSREYLKSLRPSSHRRSCREIIDRKGRTQSSLGPFSGVQSDNCVVHIWSKWCPTRLRCRGLWILTMWQWGQVRYQTCQNYTWRPTSHASDVTFRPYGIALSADVSFPAEFVLCTLPHVNSRFVPSSQVVQCASGSPNPIFIQNSRETESTLVSGAIIR